ncbi:acetyltransferase [Pantanalinema rosaneae CENA516]|uniref:acetyltransferase n=1 Tax=Pantanalinema rosaneae TaxID=1620701 RepID=UPI003D6FED12
MLLQKKETGDLIKVLDTDALINPNQSSISGRVQAGQEEQDPEEITKENLVFPSGEKLPRCWLDAEYQAKT